MEARERMSNMDALLFASALEVALLQIRVVEGCTEIQASKWQSMSRSEKSQREKLVADRELVKDVLRRTLVEVAETGEWSTLQQAVDILSEENSSSVSKRLDHEQLKSSYEEIASELTTKREQWQQDLQTADQTVAFLRDQIKDDLLNANTRLRYAEKWLCARAESLDLKCQMQVLATAPRPDHEQRIHDELVRAFQLQIKEREDATEYWRVRYENDIAKMNLSLTEKRQQWHVTLARREELQKLFDLHEGEIDSWLTFKRERAERLALEEHLRASATRIQAWWRGIMVLRALGAFRYLKNVKKSPTKSKKK